MTPFSLLIGLGASLGLLRVLQTAPASSRLRWLLAALITQIGALVGARAGYVISNLGYFKTHTQEIAALHMGGLFWPGALAGALLFGLITLLLLKLPVFEGLDRLMRMLLPLSLFAWLACWQAGLAYGRPLSAGTSWGMLMTDESGMRTLRLPLQPLAALSLILVLGAVEMLTKKMLRPGLKAGMIGLVFSLHAVFFSWLQTDPIQHYLSFRLDTWAAALFSLASLAFLIFILIRKPQGSEKPT